MSSSTRRDAGHDSENPSRLQPEVWMEFHPTKRSASTNSGGWRTVRGVASATMVAIPHDQQSSPKLPRQVTSHDRQTNVVIVGESPKPLAGMRATLRKGCRRAADTRGSPHCFATLSELKTQRSPGLNLTRGSPHCFATLSELKTQRSPGLNLTRGSPHCFATLSELKTQRSPVNGQGDVLAGGQRKSSLVANESPRGYASFRVVRWVRR